MYMHMQMGITHCGSIYGIALLTASSLCIRWCVTYRLLTCKHDAGDAAEDERVLVGL